jgi:DNA-binding LacI/PurR family transcriptional regulator
MSMAPRQDAPRAPVMRDVARLAGVSHQTVSRVLNGEESVRPAVRQRVEAAIAQLGYRRNASARALASRRTMNLGVLSTGTSQYGPSQTLFAIADTARLAGYATVLITLTDTGRPAMRAAFEQLTRDLVDGIIVLAPLAAAANAAESIDVDVPLVMFEPGLDNGTTMISVDEGLGARLATRHLLDLGHRTVHHVSGPDGWLGSLARVNGWREEVSAAGRVAPPPLVGDWTAGSGYEAGRAIAQDPDVTALFVANDQMALGVLAALADAGRAVPGDVSVVGFDDTPESALFRPALTTVALDFAEVGRRCVRRLLQLVAGGSPLEPDPPIRPQLVVRESTSAQQAAARRRSPARVKS